MSNKTNSFPTKKGDQFTVKAFYKGNKRYKTVAEIVAEGYLGVGEILIENLETGGSCLLSDTKIHIPQ